jgi:hypothetical protein
MSKLPASRERYEVRVEAERLLHSFEIARPERFAQLRDLILHRHAEDCPPLLVMDLIGVLVNERYQLHYSKLHPRGSVIPNRESMMLQQVALEEIIAAVPELAQEAGLVPNLTVTLDSRRSYSLRLYYEWGRSVLDPALLEFQKRWFAADPARRGDRLAMAVLRATQHGTLEGSGPLIRAAMQRALEDLGLRQEDEPPLSREEFFWHMQPFIEHSLTRGDLMYRGRDGRDRLGWRQLRTELKRALRESGDLQPGVRPIESPVGDLLDVATNRSGPSPSKTRGAEGEEVDDVTSAVYVRELRDQLDRNPAVRQLFNASKVRGEKATRMVAELLPLIHLLDHRDDQARKAAILYLWFDQHAGSVPGGRKQVAERFGVSEKQLRDRESAAREDLAALSRRTG